MNKILILLTSSFLLISCKGVGDWAKKMLGNKSETAKSSPKVTQKTIENATQVIQFLCQDKSSKKITVTLSYAHNGLCKYTEASHTTSNYGPTPENILILLDKVDRSLCDTQFAANLAKRYKNCENKSK